MTDDTLREECERLLVRIAMAVENHEWMEHAEEMLLAFARAQQAAGLREAARRLLIDPDNVCDWSDTARIVADAMSNHLEAQATAREKGTPA